MIFQQARPRAGTAGGAKGSCATGAYWLAVGVPWGTFTDCQQRTEWSRLAMCAGFEACVGDSNIKKEKKMYRRSYRISV